MAVCFINVIKEESEISDYLDALPKNTILNSIQTEIIAKDSIHVAVEQGDTWSFQVTRPEKDNKTNPQGTSDEGDQLSTNTNDAENDKPEST